MKFQEIAASLWATSHSYYSNTPSLPASGRCLGLRPTIRYVEDGGPSILRLYSTVKYFYTAFEKGTPPKDNQQFKQVHLLEATGRFKTFSVS